MGGGSTTTTQKTDNSPWKPTQDPLKAAVGVAGNLWAQGVGSQVYPGSTVSPFSTPTQTALTQGMDMAQQPNGLATQAADANSQMLTGGGINPFMQSSYDNWNPSASGSMLNSNPFLNQALDYQSGKVADQINSVFSGAGRTGSGAHAQALAKELAGLRFGAASDNYNFERQMQQNAISGQAGLGQSAYSNLLSAIQQAPTTDAGRFDNIDRMLKMGQIIENKQGQVLTENKDKFDQQNNMPWTQLERFLSVISPPASGFASQQAKSTQSNPFNPMSLVGVPLTLNGSK